MDGETLNRNIPHRAGNEDVASWKMCVPKSLRETVLRENRDAPSAGYVENARFAGGREDVDPKAGGTMGHGMCRLRWTPTKI